MQQEFLISDTETAGLEGGVCDVAIIAVDKDLNELWRHESLVDPERPISPSASGVHGIVDEMVYNAPTLSEWAEVYNNPFKRNDLVIVGHNISFDIRMLAAVLPETLRKLCTLRLAKLLWPEAENHKLQTLRYMFRLEAGEAHRAMGDVITCFSILRLAADKLQTDMFGLMEFCKQPTMKPDSKIGFGKHKGTKLKDLPKSYVKWLLDPERNLDEDLKEALLALQ